ncbi:ATP-dependent nuclease, partial [Chitinimonas sp. JJ19]|uniref:ATP-dependent nuclease n=1 Tax=Chitinimonas sp. JJ19 TaxID=3109352 RepID=UPI0030021B02
YVAEPEKISSVPIEYYRVEWLGFSGNPIRPRALPLRSAMIDPTSISNTYAANKYVLEIVRDYLTSKQRADLALAYRQMRGVFLSDGSVIKINEELAKKTGTVSHKTLSVAMDTTTRASWETGVMPHLDDIPLTLAGKGEQNAIKIKLAVEAESACDVLLLEEPENHLSYSNLNRLIAQIEQSTADRQVIVTTHSSFVMNKLGVGNILMFNGEKAVTLDGLPHETRQYFMRLPGHDTLRMVLSRKVILVEGPSDELVVQKAYLKMHGKMPLDDGVDVISVHSLAFPRFLDIAAALRLETIVIRDNDGDAASKRERYASYTKVETIKVCVDSDDTCKTLEPQLIKANGLARLNKLLGKAFDDDAALLKHMTDTKAESALAIFESSEPFEIPAYIADAIK